MACEYNEIKIFIEKNSLFQLICTWSSHATLSMPTHRCVECRLITRKR